MSIVQLDKVTFVGLTEDRERLLQDLQELGCLHIEPFALETENQAATGASAGTREALQFLRDYPQRRRQSKDIARFDALEIERKTLDVRQRLQALSDERDFLIKRIQDMRPWGDFEFSPLPEMGGLRLWFYVIPHRDMVLIRDLPLVHEIVKKDNRYCYVVVVSESEPEGMPVNRTHIGSRPRHELEARLEEVEVAIEDVQAERAYLTRWYSLLRENIATLEDKASLDAAQNQTYTKSGLFALRGWAPHVRLAELQGYARRHGVHMDAREAQPDDNPPTYLDNPPWLAAGENLVNFYMTPGYKTWDPSQIVFVSFALFFAMILADAGYALVLGAFLLAFWRKMGASPGGRRFRPLCLAIVILSLLYGVMVGSYFGVAPPAGTPLAALHVLDMSNTDLMMQISVCIGCIHVILGAVLDAARYKSLVEGLASIGWACIVAAGLVFVLSTAFGLGILKPLSVVLIGTGALLVLLFTAPFEKPLSRLLNGLLGLTKLSGAFGDVLSYLRLFALGLASGSLAAEFNHMALGLKESIPGVGIVVAFLVLLLGHVVNLVLGLASSVIHGLRLNVIEFFNWGLKEEGSPFRPFRRSER
ncbi:V-type ATPase 116kDa subunit family protein [Methylobacter sp.]|uniref:V-type ATP synthase subunit I n=1 Tax=Methylobacter sp. TaxID=2051955 RepID=UPI00120A7C28|nr:V-type ATPase 116kDa subunit family protein [Methylobacter sp.]TAK60140.1 MAG: ATPase V [Methylobacter sp.]